MRIEIARRGRQEHVLVARRDGTNARFAIPQKGPVSHDLVHYCVEDALGMQNAFWGSVAAGEDPEDLQARAIAGGHASAKRAAPPSPDIVELLQAERLVECFEAERWSGLVDDAGLMGMARAGWAASHVPALQLTAEDLAAIRKRLGSLGARWQALPEGEALVLQWDR